jgi:hypothetical protein
MRSSVETLHAENCCCFRLSAAETDGVEEGKKSSKNVLFIEKQRSAWGYLYECLTA